MSDLTATARRLGPRLSSPAFAAVFGELSDARVAYEQAPRGVQQVAQLARARARLDEARMHMRSTLHEQLA